MDDKIKGNIRRLNRLIKVFQDCDFYFVGAASFEVRMQAKFDPKIVKIALKNKFTVSASKELGFIELIRDNYTITLI